MTPYTYCLIFFCHIGLNKTTNSSMWLALTGTKKLVIFRVTKITFLPHSDAYFELEQVILIISKCQNALSCFHVIFVLESRWTNIPNKFQTALPFNQICAIMIHSCICKCPLTQLYLCMCVCVWTQCDLNVWLLLLRPVWCLSSGIVAIVWW